MSETYQLFLEALRCALRNETVDWVDPLPNAEWWHLIRLAQEHSVIPIFAQAVYSCPALQAAPLHEKALRRVARQMTIYQARRTAEFLLLYDSLQCQGLSPAVMKGIICRSLYPFPEQRPSVDEDLLVKPEEFPRYHAALTAYGLPLMSPEQPLDGAYEVPYRDDVTHLYIELHMCPLPPDSEAYGDCNTLFVDALDRTVTVEIGGIPVRTLAPTDHLLYLICHAYKHFLHGGVGIRQVCDIALMTRAYGDRVDWTHILESCRSIRIDHFAAAVFRITERHLGFEVPAAFAEIGIDESDLLEDTLSGGLYGVEDIDRAHSSTLTLDAVAADRHGKRRGGVLRSVFLPARSLVGRFPYLHRYPVLLPVAWGQRIWGYLSRKNGSNVHPARSVEIGNRRIELLKEYGIID